MALKEQTTNNIAFDYLLAGRLCVEIEESCGSPIKTAAVWKQLPLEQRSDGYI